MKSTVDTSIHPAFLTLGGSILSYAILLVIVTIVVVLLPYLVFLSL